MRHLTKATNSNRVINDGHFYELENFENKDANGQCIQFIEKSPDPNDTTKLITLSDGTTNEEVLQMLIHRCNVLYSKFPSRETALAITKMEEALMWLEKRTRDRIARGVEGKHIK